MKPIRTAISSTFSLHTTFHDSLSSIKPGIVCSSSLSRISSVLTCLSFCRQFALHARNYSVNEAYSGNRMIVRPYACGNCCLCCQPCCCKPPLDASEYYTSEERRLALLVEEEKVKVMRSLYFLRGRPFRVFFERTTGHQTSRWCRICDFCHQCPSFQSSGRSPTRLVLRFQPRNFIADFSFQAASLVGGFCSSS